MTEKLSKYEHELVWFGAGVILAFIMACSLEYCIDEIIRLPQTKMEEPQQVTMKEPQQVMMEGPKKVVQGKKMAEEN